MGTECAKSEPEWSSRRDVGKTDKQISGVARLCPPWICGIIAPFGLARLAQPWHTRGGKVLLSGGLNGVCWWEAEDHEEGNRHDDGGGEVRENVVFARHESQPCNGSEDAGDRGHGLAEAEDAALFVVMGAQGKHGLQRWSDEGEADDADRHDGVEIGDGVEGLRQSQRAQADHHENGPYEGDTFFAEFGNETSDDASLADDENQTDEREEVEVIAIADTEAFGQQGECCFEFCERECGDEDREKQETNGGTRESRCGLSENRERGAVSWRIRWAW